MHAHVFPLSIFALCVPLLILIPTPNDAFQPSILCCSFRGRESTVTRRYATTPGSLIERLEELKLAEAQGLITAQEFESSKGRMLASYTEAKPLDAVARTPSEVTRSSVKTQDVSVFSKESDKNQINPRKTGKAKKKLKKAQDKAKQSAQAIAAIQARTVIAPAASTVTPMSSKMPLKPPVPQKEVKPDGETTPKSKSAALSSEEYISSFPTSTALPPPARRQSLALPFMQAPEVLDGSLAGDAGFDPLGFATTRENLFIFREAEIKHARLAMLAAAGWPIAELVHPGLARGFGLTSLLAAGGRSPSVLNGGLSQPAVALFAIMAFMGAAAVEISTLDRQYLNPSDYVSSNPEKLFRRKQERGIIPGIYGFDPLGLYSILGNNEKARFNMQVAEIKNGRLAMLGITGFAIQEFALRRPVIDQTPAFFKPGSLETLADFFSLIEGHWFVSDYGSS